jgi:hypothetical protein
MKRMLTALTLALLVSLVAASVATSAPPNDFTTGAGKVSTIFTGRAIENKFSFSAHAEDANSLVNRLARNGQYHVEGNVSEIVGGPPGPGFSQTADVQGKVDCIRVSGNQAFVGGPIQKSSNPAYEGLNAYFDVVDNDQPPLSGAAPDQFLFELITPQPECLLPTSGAPITQGNIVVNDAPVMAAGVTAAQEPPPQREGSAAGGSPTATPTP